ncbi:hypothetical protein Tco_1417059 [Tanacetum coccineum]
MSATRQGMNYVSIKQLIAQRVADAMTACEANQASGNGAHNETSRSARGVEHAVRSCSYKEFLACKPINFKGTEGAVGLTRCIGLDAAYETTWNELKEMMIDEYFPRNEIHKMKTKLWNLSVKGTDNVGYTRRF